MEKQQPPRYLRLRRERIRRNWSQADVAKHIGSDPKTVSRWELGHAFPSAYHRQKLVDLFQKDAEELGLLGETTQDNHKGDNVQQFTSSHLPQPTTAVTHSILPANMESMTDLSQQEHALSVFAPSDRDLAVNERADLLPWHEDWGEAPSVESFYGRVPELAEVMQWILDEHCRMVVVLGIGGVGKTTFATMVARQVRYDFEHIFWRSLQQAPAVEHILESCLQSFSDQQSPGGHNDLDEQISQLITFLRTHRSLLILDNVESVLQAGQRAGHYAEVFQGYGRLFRRIGESQHQSCLILTTREKPREVGLLEGHSSPVRSLTLPGVELAVGQQLLQSKDLFGSDEAWASLVEAYSGNPLALKLIAEPIRAVFGGDIAAFLKTHETVFGEIHDLLNEQFQRLSELEQHIMYWLAIEREAITLSDLQDLMLPGSTGSLLEAVDSLYRRCLLESSDGRFTLQPIIMEYFTAHFIEQITHEIASGTIKLLGSHALIRA
ncbi:MAG: helix-turn-helix domain-containing protein, partial [Chloroflexi bacterium]|nr:helix-turn-helix domain-containing protein [Chloroflexota bacterium]